ncbi:MAG: amidohydrolase family protein, partial [Clostridiales bacterium]|nr:amidohydrolase family protein [Clostridiales bacterium]
PELNEGAQAAASMAAWVLEMRGRYDNVKPIVTPRFIPSCSGQLLTALGQLAGQYDLPVQSHLAENQNETAWVRKLEPQSRHYADAYDRYGLLEGRPTVMAHCVHLSAEEMRLLRKRRVFIAHCPQSNTNLLSGAAPVKTMLSAGMKLGLATDMAGGAHISMLRAIQDAVAVSKMRAVFCERPEDTLSVAEAFYMATKGGGAFFGQAGSFEPGYAADVLVIDDSSLMPRGLTLRQRLERAIYQADSRHLLAKYVAGKQLAL